MKNEKLDFIIAENAKNESNTLDLSNLELDVIPDEIFNLTHLQVLKLINNKIKSIPEKIWELKNLTHIYLYQNEINDIPFSALAKMKFLECIDLGENPIRINNLDKITKVYREFDKWIHYRQLVKIIKEKKESNKTNSIFFNGYLPELPPELFELNYLKYLSLDNSGLKRLPLEIERLQDLVGLYICNAELSNLPREILMLNKLETVNFDGNKFTNFPEILLDHKSIKSISFNENLITHIKPVVDEIVQNNQIQNFFCIDNPIKDFNAELFEGGLSYIREFVYGIKEEEE